MDSPDLISLFEYFDQKISNACTKLALLDVYSRNDRNECIEMNVNIGTIQVLLREIDQCLYEAENEFQIQSKRCVNLLQLLSDHVDHIETNLNEIQMENNKLITRNVTYTNMDTKKIRKNDKKSNIAMNDKKNGHLMRKPMSSSKSTTTASTVKSNNREDEMKTKSSTNLPFPMMEHLNDSEFNSIPKYMLSRLTLSTLNESIDAFNHSIMCKYMFIRKFDIQSTKETDYKRYQQYKAQENVDTKGIYFVTINDIKELTTMKNDSTLRKVLICLRHCKRIKEIRGGQQPKLIRYGLI
ncbi:hypothetical protein BLA29_004691 [Euroglyphus maynei]|uniref:SKA complex subunit 1 n=1 Tax=Euroglyphus maynei TaxID=6958 RepID=A0A1Y3B5Q9_EURMA|nr:hypothetical protein BLA29_004691 [Euroglyphus maynei]